MKILARTSTASRLANCEKAVRRFMEEWFYDGGVLFSDRNMRCNRLYMDWYNSDSSEKWFEYVYRNRHEIFDDYVISKIEEADKFTDSEKDHMLDYYNNMNMTDYNRLFMLKRDSTDRGVQNKLRLLNLVR